MKGTLRLSLLFALFLGLVPSSCNIRGCDDPLPYKINLNRLSVSFRGLDLNPDTPVTVLPNGDFRLEVVPYGPELYASNVTPSAPLFTQSLMASKKCNPNYCTGFVIDIDSFSISCDTFFRGKVAGAALNDYFNVFLVQYGSTPKYDEIMFSFSGFNDSLRQDPELLIDGWRTHVFTIEAIEFIQPGNYRFTITMLLKDGTLISKEADIVHFE